MDDLGNGQWEGETPWQLGKHDGTGRMVWKYYDILWYFHTLGIFGIWKSHTGNMMVLVYAIMTYLDLEWHLSD